MPRRRTRSKPQPAPLPPPLTATVPRVSLHPINPAPPKSAIVLTATPLYRNIWHIPNFLTLEETTAWLSYAHQIGFTPSFHEATPETAFRDNGRLEESNPQFAAKLFRRLQPVIPRELADGEPIACYDKIRIYEYKEGQRFGKHIDESVQLSDGATGATVLVYLSECEGGETVFYEGNQVLRVRPEPGSLLIHGHGENCLEHEGAAVISGTKYVLRTDIVYSSHGAPHRN